MTEWNGVEVNIRCLSPVPPRMSEPRKPIDNASGKRLVTPHDLHGLILHRATSLPDVLAMLLASYTVRSDAHLSPGPEYAVSVLLPETVRYLVDRLWPPGVRPTPATASWQIRLIRQNTRATLARLEREAQEAREKAKPSK